MIHLGIDVESVNRFRRMKGVWEPFYRRVYTPAERAAFGTDPILLSLCLTAKEAVAKVLGTGLYLGDPGRVDSREIEITCDVSGRDPQVHLSGRALEVKEHLQLACVLLLLYHNSEYAYSISGAGDAGLAPQWIG